MSVVGFIVASNEKPLINVKVLKKCCKRLLTTLTVCRCAFHQTFLNLFRPAYFKSVQAMTAKLFCLICRDMTLLSCHTCIYDFITHDDTTSIIDVPDVFNFSRVPPLQSPVWVDIRFTISKTTHNSWHRKKMGKHVIAFDDFYTWW